MINLKTLRIKSSFSEITEGMGEGLETLNELDLLLGSTSNIQQGGFRHLSSLTKLLLNFNYRSDLNQNI